MQNVKENGPITWNAVKTWLPIVLAFATILVSIGVIMQTIDTHEVRMTKIEMKQEAYDEALTRIQVQLAEIQRDVTYLRQQWENQRR